MFIEIDTTSHKTMGMLDALVRGLPTTKSSTTPFLCFIRCIATSTYTYIEDIATELLVVAVK